MVPDRQKSVDGRNERTTPKLYPSDLVGENKQGRCPNLAVCPNITDLTLPSWDKNPFSSNDISCMTSSASSASSGSDPISVRKWTTRVVSIKSQCSHYALTLCLLTSSAGNGCNQFRPRSGPTGLNWIKTVCHSDGIPEIFVRKKLCK